MERLILGGVDLSANYEVVGIRRPMPSLVPDMINVPGLNGYAFGGADILPQPIQFTLVSKVMDYAERRRDMRQLAATLCNREPMRVYFSNDEGLYYEAVVNEPPDYQEFVTFGATTVTMQPLHSAMYGKTLTVTVPSGGSVRFHVGGTYPTMPKITATATRDSGTQLWGLLLDDTSHLHIATGSASARSIVADCAGRTLTVQGAVAIPTLDSDWLTFEPGEHVLEMDNGTGAASVTFCERWL